MFTTLIVQPIFNLLVLIYALIPGHNFGLAVIIFTVLVRLLMWPLVRKQLHHAKAIRSLQPELKKIKVAAKGDKQKTSQLTMELYKERQINPFSTIGIVIVQAIIFIGLYIGLRKIIDNPKQIISFSYSPLHHLGWMKALAGDIHRFDDSLLGAINLTRKAVDNGGVYWPAFVLAASSAIAQFFQSKQLMPKSEDSRGLRQILKEAGQGKTADQQEVSAAVGRSTMFFIPGVIFLVSISLPSALPLYWLVSSLTAIWQQSRILGEDVAEAEAVADEPTIPKPSGEEDKKAGQTSKAKRAARRRARRRKR